MLNEIRKARVRTIAKQLRSIGHGTKPRKVIPKQQQPDHLRRDYFREITNLVCEKAASFVDIYKIVELLKDVRVAQGKTDGIEEDKHAKAKALIAEAKQKFGKLLNGDLEKDIEKAAGRLAVRVGNFQHEQFDKQVKAGLGFSFSAVETPVRAAVPGWIKENVDLIKTVPDRYFDRLQDDVETAFKSGTHPNTLYKQLSKEYEISKSDAMRIARDQIGKLNAQFNQMRQESLGIDGYIWRTANDNRVRDEHEERDGEFYAWDDPPEGGHPGEDIQCRCYAEPSLDRLLGTNDITPDYEGSDE